MDNTTTNNTATNDDEPEKQLAADTELPYGPTKRSSEFTYEDCKLEISNLPFKATFHLVKHLLEKTFKINPRKIRVGTGKAYVAFDSAQQRDAAIEKIHNHDLKGVKLVAVPAAPRHDPFAKKVRTNQSSEDKANDVDDEPISIPTDEEINNQVCPLINKTYEEQLKIKDATMRGVLDFSKQLSKLVPSLQRDAPRLYEWIQAHKKICCQYDGVTPSPSLVGYRNKCEFNVGSDGVVGFRMGRYKNGSERVMSPPVNCPIVNDNMRSIVNTFQGYLNSDRSTKLRPYNHITHEGNYRQLTVRTNEASESLVIIDLHPQDMNTESIEAELAPLVDLLKEIDSVKIIYVNISQKNNLGDASLTLKLLHGQSEFYETLTIEPDRPLKFRIGPLSFFQVNTKAAELLYKSIKDVAGLDSNSLVLDVGCGTGTIGLSLARSVSYVIGIEISKPAIEDAKANAKLNGISNVAFFAGKAEDLINECITILKSKRSDQNNVGDIVAIVDPPRIGFNTSFIKSLRASNIKNIVYVACDPKSNNNLVSLCRPESKAYQGEPFVPVRAKAFDMFPHTKFCELVVLYKKLGEAQDE